MAAYQQFPFMECYVTNVVHDPAEVGVNIVLLDPAYAVTGVVVQRYVHRRNVGPDILLYQEINNDVNVYDKSVSLLGHGALFSSENLRQWVAFVPPPERVVPDAFNNVAWTWEDDFAGSLANQVNDELFDGANPFLVEATEVFGFECVLNAANNWQYGDWRTNAPPFVVPAICAICQEDITENTPVDNLYMLCCGHMFHRACILTWVWEHHRCAICDLQI